MADKVGTCRNAQGGGDDEVTLGGGARGGHNLNLHEDEANRGRGAERDVDPDEECMLRLMHALHVKAAIPVFKGDKNEDPIEFKTKALDYMEATDIPVQEHVVEFRHCLEGKARMWYDEITLPRTWNELMGMFCAQFCIYGKSNKDWYRHWASLHFDPASDADIDDLINEVRSVARLSNSPDMVVLATLKNMFPSYQLHFLNVNDLPTMFRMLHAMFPRNRHQSIVGAHSRATPFSVHQDKSSTVPVSGKPKKVTKCDKPVHHNECVLDDAFDRLQDSINHLTVMTERKDCNGHYCPGRYKRNPPFKPMITRCQWNRYSQSSPPFHRNHSYQPTR